MARRILVPLAVTLSLVGCAPPRHWFKPDTSPQIADQRQAYCQLTAEQSHYSSEEEETARTARVERWTDLCMRADGWQHVTEDEEHAVQQANDPRRQAASQQANQRLGESAL